MYDRRLLLEKSLSYFSRFFALFIALVTVSILLLVLIRGIGHISIEFLTRAPEGDMTGGGIGPMILGTVWLVILMSLFTVPLGAIAAIYLNEVSKRGVVYNLGMSAVRTLAAVPSIVYGLFGLAFFVTVIGGGLDFLAGNDQEIFRRRSLLWAAMTMGTLTLPTNIISVTEALKIVTLEQRLAGFCLGYTRWEVIKWIVLPQALGGVLTGLVLSISRGAGEVAPILFVGVAYYIPEFTGNPLEQFMELGYHIFVMATQSPNVDETIPIQFATTLTLLVITFLFNSVGQIIRFNHRKKNS